MGHEHGKHGNPEDVDSYIARMEDPERAAWQKPDELLRALKVAPGQVACDIGAGPGYFALRMARIAAQVFAVDVEPRMLQGLVKRIVKSGLRNVTPVFGWRRAAHAVHMGEARHQFNLATSKADDWPDSGPSLLPRV